MNSAVLHPAVLTLTLVLSAANASAATAPEQCRTDLESIPAFLLANDTGAPDELGQRGQAHFDAALVQARSSADHAQDNQACDQALNEYLKSWRKGHLLVRDATGPDSLLVKPEAWRTPTIRFLSAETALLTVPSFAGRYREPLALLIGQQHRALAARANWIIDVRGNNGGDDATYAPLLSWLLPDGWEDAGAEWLVTAANIEGQETVCARVEPGDTACQRFMAKAIERMRGVASGTYVQQADGPAIRHKHVAKIEPSRPSRVAILMDSGCGSSCEEFLLSVRQSFQVKLMGRPSFGSLDYSNLRAHTLPSGQRVLWYATSRSNRLPGLSVDVAGVQPDVYLPEAVTVVARDDEVFQAQRWLEGGSLSPQAASAERRAGDYRR
jgi:hypothetical protein